MGKGLKTIKDIASEEFTALDTVNRIHYKDRNVSLKDLRRLATEWHKALDEIYLDDEATERFFDKYGMDKKSNCCCAVIRKIFDLGMEKEK